MAKLLDILYTYAAENLVVRFQQRSAVKKHAAQRKAEELTNQLKDMAPGVEDHVKELKIVWDAMDDYHSQAVFLAGLSIGLELGRL